MIASMTAFSRQSHEATWGLLTWEIRTVNHRYLEITLRLPDFLREFEQASREAIQKVLRRGKVEATLRFQPGWDVPFEMNVNQVLTERLAKASETVISYFPSATINAIDVLSWPGVLQTKETQVDVIGKAVFALLNSALTDCMDIRRREGEGLKLFIEERLNNVKGKIAIIKKRLSALHQAAREKMIARFEELSLALDKERLEQEMLWLVQKSDVAEELQRLEAHLLEVKRVLVEGGTVGRRLDFLMQELNREANTLGNKSLDADVSQVVVDLKVQIEQMREQVQNIE
ncbi:YicC family protein [Coxiella burnetii]|uniref:Protein YicC n=1 Tax=Coxiella burnetii (strain Dugway 5J108-111) TaxID=434922 RepID=A9KGR8_COXBN|nr:YicC/YloC family endoribonuclease [Coxiella burnetii]ABS76787.1 protein YicC [Coxiella burnetii Dugway 5J108-111]OYK81732.1 YicC family protein [Coxiella burnetii]